LLAVPRVSRTSVTPQMRPAVLKVNSCTSSGSTPARQHRRRRRRSGGVLKPAPPSAAHQRDTRAAMRHRKRHDSEGLRGGARPVTGSPSSPPPWCSARRPRTPRRSSTRAGR
jgi:hypothetical protein